MSKKSKMAENMKILQDFNDSSDSDEKDDAIGEMVYLDIEGFTAEDGDSAGIQSLLAEVLIGLEVNFCDLTDLIISQNYVGCVLKQVMDDKDAMEDEDENGPSEEFPLGLNTVINLTHKRKHHAACTEALRSGLLKHSEASSALPETKERFRALLSSNSAQCVGLILNERLVNMPVDVSVPAFESLQTDIEAANKIQMPFTFDYFLVVCQTYKINTLKSRRKAKKNKKQAQQNGSVGEEGGSPKLVEVFYNSEEEVFAEFAECTFEYSVSEYAVQNNQSWYAKETDERRTSQLRRVLLIPADKMGEAVQAARLKLLS